MIVANCDANIERNLSIMSNNSFKSFSFKSFKKAMKQVGRLLSREQRPSEKKNQNQNPNAYCVSISSEMVSEVHGIFEDQKYPNEQKPGNIEIALHQIYDVSNILPDSQLSEITEEQLEKNIPTDGEDDEEDEDEDEDDDSILTYSISPTNSIDLLEDPNCTNFNVPNLSTIESEEIIYDLDPDFYLPKGILQMTSVKMSMRKNPHFHQYKIGLFRQKHKIMMKSYKNLSQHPEKKRAIYHELEILKMIGCHSKLHQLYGYTWYCDSNEETSSNSSSASASNRPASFRPPSSSSSSSTTLCYSSSETDAPDVHHHHHHHHQSSHNPLQFQMIYELACYGNLVKLLEEKDGIPIIPMSLMISWCADITEAMAFLHSKGIVHGDISAENIFVYERLDIKIGNFSTSHVLPIATEKVTSTLYDSTFLTEEEIIEQPGFQIDHIGFVHTLLQMFTRKDKNALRIDISESKFPHNLQLYCQDVLYQLPLMDYTAGLEIYKIISPTFLLPQLQSSSSSSKLQKNRRYSHHQVKVQEEQQLPPLSAKSLSDQFATIMEQRYDGDPRDRMSYHSYVIKRVELLVMASTKQIHQLIQLSPRLSLQTQMILKRLITSIRKRMREHQLRQQQQEKQKRHSNPEGRRSLLKQQPFDLMEEAFCYLPPLPGESKLSNPDYIPDKTSILKKIERIYDPRYLLINWLQEEYSCSESIAEEVTLLLITNGIISPKSLEKHFLKNRYFLPCLFFPNDDTQIMKRITEQLTEQAEQWQSQQ